MKAAELIYAYEEVKGKTVFISLIEDGEESKEFIHINSIEDYKLLQNAVAEYEEEGILDEYYTSLK
jgi:hypothetical protein